jgi:hypothetical protein
VVVRPKQPLDLAHTVSAPTSSGQPVRRPATPPSRSRSPPRKHPEPSADPNEEVGRPPHSARQLSPSPPSGRGSERNPLLSNWQHAQAHLSEQAEQRRFAGRDDWEAQEFKEELPEKAHTGIVGLHGAGRLRVGGSIERPPSTLQRAPPTNSHGYSL